MGQMGPEELLSGVNMAVCERLSETEYTALISLGVLWCGLEEGRDSPQAKPGLAVGCCSVGAGLGSDPAAGSGGTVQSH
jgi:hypothetical protein